MGILPSFPSPENPLCKINHFIDKINLSPPFFLSYILAIIGCMLKKGQRSTCTPFTSAMTTPSLRPACVPRCINCSPVPSRSASFIRSAPCKRQQRKRRNFFKPVIYFCRIPKKCLQNLLIYGIIKLHGRGIECAR